MSSIPSQPMQARNDWQAISAQRQAEAEHTSGISSVIANHQGPVIVVSSSTCHRDDTLTARKAQATARKAEVLTRGGKAVEAGEILELNLKNSHRAKASAVKCDFNLSPEPELALKRLVEGMGTVDAFPDPWQSAATEFVGGLVTAARQLDVSNDELIADLQAGDIDRYTEAIEEDHDQPNIFNARSYSNALRIADGQTKVRDDVPAPFNRAELLDFAAKTVSEFPKEMRAGLPPLDARRMEKLVQNNGTLYVVVPSDASAAVSVGLLIEAVERYQHENTLTSPKLRKDLKTPLVVIDGADVIAPINILPTVAENASARNLDMVVEIKDLEQAQRIWGDETPILTQLQIDNAQRIEQAPKLVQPRQVLSAFD